MIRGIPRGGPPPERTVCLSNVTAPRLARRPNPNAEGSVETKDEVRGAPINIKNIVYQLNSFKWMFAFTVVPCLVFMLKVKVWFYIALYPVRWTAQSALHFPPLADLFIPTPFSASLGSILAMQQLRNDYSLTFPPLSIARYSFIQLSRLRRREVKENAQTSKR